jgi:hypothetical protein
MSEYAVKYRDDNDTHTPYTEVELKAVRLVLLAEDLFAQAPLVKRRSLDIIVPTRTR